MDAGYIILFLLILLMVLCSCLFLYINVMICLCLWLCPCSYHLIRRSLFQIFDTSTSYQSLEDEVSKDLQDRMLQDTPLSVQQDDDNILAMSNPNIQEDDTGPADVTLLYDTKISDESSGESSDHTQNKSLLADFKDNSSEDEFERDVLLEDDENKTMKTPNVFSTEGPLELDELKRKIDEQSIFGVITTRISGGTLTVKKYEDIQSCQQKFRKCSVTVVISFVMIYSFCIIPFFICGLFGWLPHLILGLISIISTVDAGSGELGTTTTMVVFSVFGILIGCLVVPVSSILCLTCLVFPNRSSEIVTIDRRRKRIGVATGIPVLFLCESIPIWVRYISFNDISQVHLISKTDRKYSSSSSSHPSHSGSWFAIGDYVYFSQEQEEEPSIFKDHEYGSILVTTKNKKTFRVFQNVYLGSNNKNSKVTRTNNINESQKTTALILAKDIAARANSPLRRVEGKYEPFNTEDVIYGRCGSCFALSVSCCFFIFIFTFALVITVWFIMDVAEGDVFLAIVVGVTMFFIDLFVCLLCVCLCIACVNTCIECLWFCD